MPNKKFGQCSICTSSFDFTNISSLKCGHTFHSECIIRWIAGSKSCPHCRTTNTMRDVTRLFFEESENTLNQSIIESSQEDKTELLQQKLKEALDAKFAIELTLVEYRDRISSLDIQIRVEKKKTEKLARMAEHIKQLEALVDDQAALKWELEKFKSRYTASEFYNLLMRKSDANEADIDRYIAGNGQPEASKFLKLLQTQRDNEIKKNKSLGELLAKERRDMNNKSREIADLRKALEKTQSELESRKRKNSNGAETRIHKEGHLKENIGDFPFMNPKDNGQVVRAASNFKGLVKPLGGQFENRKAEILCGRNFINGDESIEIISEKKPATSKESNGICSNAKQNNLAHLEPMVVCKKGHRAKASIETTKNDRAPKAYLPDELADVLSPTILSYANNV